MTESEWSHIKNKNEQEYINMLTLKEILIATYF